MKIQKAVILPLAALVVLTQSYSTSAFAALESVTLTSADAFASPRWMYGVGEAPKETAKDATSASTTLVRVKQSQVEGNDAQCAERARLAKPKAKSLQAWLTVIELECAGRMKLGPLSAAALSKGIDDAAAHADWFVDGPQASRLKTAVGTALISLIDQDLRTNRTRAWKSIERVDQFSSLFDDRTKAVAWRYAGDLSIIQQKPEAARDFFKRSLTLSESGEARDRLNAVEQTLGIVKKPVPSPTPSSPNVSALNEATVDEIDLATRATTALKSGDIVVAMDDMTKLIRTYPGGTRAKWATDRVQEVLNNFADKTDVQYQDVHDQVLSRVEQVDADRLIAFSRALYNRAQFADASRLANKALSSADGVRRSFALELASESAIATENWDQARSSLGELVEKSAGQPASREALFRLGLLDYRQLKYSEAIANFEKLLALPQIEALEVSARYWLWRSLQKTKSERATQTATELMTLFPFSYYGLRARAELGGGALEFNFNKTAAEKVESTMWLTANEKLAWEKAQILLKSGWLEEAQSELRELPSPVKAEDKAVRALVYAAAGGYVTASKLANEAWDEKPEFRRAPFTTAAFPREYSEFVEAQAKRRGLDANLVRGLIKQESSFNVRAISSSSAYGLMQMIPPTAREIAQDLKLGNLKLPEDMFVPKRNIEMGTYYLNKMVNKYSGSVPLALAAYNAGPGRMDRWLRTRASLKSLPTSKSSAPDDEIWIDEIPYSEPCYYVKAILRNIMLYRLLDKGRVETSDPIWSKQ